MMSNKILYLLPNCYRDGGEMQEIADALTRGIAEVCTELEGYLENYERDRLIAETCFPQWLDTLARWAGWGELWDQRWSIDVKRQLLLNTNYIWENRGNREILPYLFAIFNLNVTLAPATGLILGQTPFPAPLGSDPFSYIIYVPSNFTPNTDERSLVEKLAQNFLPCWCLLSIQYKP